MGVEGIKLVSYLISLGLILLSFALVQIAHLDFRGTTLLQYEGI